MSERDQRGEKERLHCRPAGRPSATISAREFIPSCRLTIIIISLLLLIALPTHAQSPSSSPAPPAPRAIPIPYRLPAEADVTLGLYDADGHLIRTLIRAEHQPAGKNVAHWDGRDQFGHIAPAGKYAVRGVAHPPIRVEPTLTIGNPGTPPYPTADGRGDWLSDEAAPQAAATDGTTVYLAAPGSEKGYSILAVGADGRRVWGYNEGSAYPRCVSLAVAGPCLYALFSGPTDAPATAENSSGRIGRAFLICLDRVTGAPARFGAQTTTREVARWPSVDQVAGLWELRARHAFTPANYEGQPRYFADDMGEPTEAVGIAAVGDRLYISMLTQNRLLVLDAATGENIDSLPLPSPVGLHALPNGKLLAVSGGKIVTIDPATKAVTTTVDHNLIAPHDVTTDRAGNLYVSDWADSFQVKVFSPDDFLLRTIGKAGGRPWVGAWEPNGMLLPRGIAVTDSGRLWVAEDDAAPNRVSVWNAATGRFVRDYLGPTPYGGGGMFWSDPADPATVIAGGVFYRVDYVRKTATPVAIPMRRMSATQPFTPTAMTAFQNARTITHAGHQYLFVSTDAYRMVVLRRDGMRLTPVAATGCLGRYTTDDGSGLGIWDSDIGRHLIPHYFPDFFAGHKGDNYVWIDRNGDGEVQPDEMQWAHTLTRDDLYQPGILPESCVSWGYSAGPDGAIYLGGFCKDRAVVSRLDLSGWTPTGAPIYDLTAANPIVVRGRDEGLQGLFVDSASHVLVSHPYEFEPSTHAIDAYTRDGKLLWTVAAPTGHQKLDGFLADNILGEFREPGGERVLASWLWHANYKPYLLTADGLYLGSLLDDTRVGPTATWDESYKHYFQTPDGAAYIVNGANDAYHVDRILGIEHLYRFTSTITVTVSDLTAASSAAILAPSPTVAKPRIRVSFLAAPPGATDDMAEWRRTGAVGLVGTKGRGARIALGKDRANLYLTYEVHGAKMINKGGVWQTLFISGDCADLMLHVGPDHPHIAPDIGDERLLFSVYQGKPIAVLYRPVVPGTTAPTRLMGASIDQVVRLTAAQVTVHHALKGYTLSATVPLAALGIDPAVTDDLHGDVGVIFADETGANRALRLYYYNLDTAMTADLTTEATLQPANWGTIALPLGPNLLRNGDFEDPLTTDPADGWAVTGARNGGEAAIDNTSAYTGARSLLLRQTVPVTFPAEAYSLPDYGDFIRSANSGKGGGYVEIRQRIPVTPGKRYQLRFRVRIVDFSDGERKDPGPGRGYIALMAHIDWEGARGNLWLLNEQDSTPEWSPLLDPRFNYYSVPLPYEAPSGATGAILRFSLVDNYAGKLPRAHIDDVEFVEVE